MPKVQVDDIQMYCEEEGRGEALVLICGLGGILREWKTQVPFFSRHFRTVVFDNRGVGKTDKPQGPYSIERFAQDTLGLMDRLGIERAHILGLSMGGMIAQEIALLHPERVDRLVLCVTHCGRTHAVMPEQWVFDLLTPPPGLTHEEILRRSFPILFTEPFIRDHSQEVEGFIQDRLTYPVQPLFAFMAQLQAAMEFDSYDRLPRIRIPTLVLTARGDVLVPPKNSEVLAQRIPNARLVVFENGGHLVNIERSEEFNKTILKFLEA